MEATAPVANVEKRAPRGSSFKKSWYRFTRRKTAVVGLAFILIQVFLCFFAPVLVDLKVIYYPYANDYSSTYQAPSMKHLMGTDEYGRDVFSRVIYGAQVSYAVGVGTQAIVTILGLIIGSMAGLIGGWVDFVIMRIIDVLSSVPGLLFYILLMIALGAGIMNVILAMSITGWIGVARLVRGQVLTLKQTDYVRASKAMGADSNQIIMSHMIRNSMTPVIISAALGIPGNMFAEAGLSYLGLGIAPPTPSWGQMIGSYQSYVIAWPWMLIWPAVVLAITMLAWILVGDGLRDALDPNIRM